MRIIRPIHDFRSYFLRAKRKNKQTKPNWKKERKQSNPPPHPPPPKKSLAQSPHGHNSVKAYVVLGDWSKTSCFIITWSVVFVRLRSKMADWPSELFGIRLLISPMPGHFSVWKGRNFTMISNSNWPSGKWARIEANRRRKKVWHGLKRRNR